MKVIDLLNKIANGEEVPKCFKVNNHTWKWNVNSYQNELYGEFAVTGLRYDLSNLNDEIEIIEEDKKIETINNFISNVGAVDENNIEEYIHKLFEQEFILFSKIEEIINCINKGDK